MGFGLSRRFRNRQDSADDEATSQGPRPAAGPSSQGDEVQGWSDQVQNHLAALLDAEDEDVLDLAALREALDEETEDDGARPNLAALREALEDEAVSSLEEPVAPDAESRPDHPPAASDGEQHEEDSVIRGRLKWLVRPFSSDEEEGDNREVHTPSVLDDDDDLDLVIDEILTREPSSNGTALVAVGEENAEPDTSETEPVEPEQPPVEAALPPSSASTPQAAAPQATPPRTAEPEVPTPAVNPQAAAMQQVLSDPVMMTLLQQGTVPFPTALQAMEALKGRSGTPLWRGVVDLPDVDRDAVFAAVAQIHGLAGVTLDETSLSALHDVQELLPASLKRRLPVLNLLPLHHDDAGRLVCATHDPTHPALAAFLAETGVDVQLCYAPEAAVARLVEQAQAYEPEPPSGDTLAGDASLELDWEPSAAPEPEEDEATLNGVVWKPLATFTEDLELDIDEALAASDDPEAADDEGAATGESNRENAEKQQKDLDLHLEIEEASKGPTPGIDLAAAAESKQKPDHATEDTLPDLDLKKIKAKDRVVATLLGKGIVTPHDVKRAVTKQQQEQLKEPLWRVMTLTDSTNRNAIFAEAASVYAFKPAQIGEEKIDPEFARSVMETFEDPLRDALLQLRIVPLEVELDQQTGAIKVVFITHDPTRPEVHRTMQKLKLERFELRYAPEHTVTNLIVEAFPRKNEFLERMAEHSSYDLGMAYDDKGSDLIDEDALEAEIGRSKLINLFEATLVEAVRQGASDVHIWPNAKKQVEIHFRIDGRLQRWHVEDKVHPEALIAVIKDNSMNVDRFERDAAQDGFIQRWIDEALIRFRVSVLPIANAAQDVRSESIVIRVLDDRKVIKDLRKLGLHELAFQRFQKAIRQPHGMVILTGPTGSGKTTTLYAALHEVVSPEVNVLTVEDPVEYILPGVRQIKLNTKLGLEGALRSILRHDPDVVMVGEMRDRETAELAIKLANTGHLTFSTLHTNDAASAVSRLYKMDIEPFLIAYAINLVVAQRLIRKLCSTCKVLDPDPDPVFMKKMGFTPDEIANFVPFMEGNDDHCPTCKGIGYKGRRAITEALYFSREIRHLVADSDGNLDENRIKDLARKQGMMTLVDSAREVVKAGETSLNEMLRVVATEE